MLTQVQCYILFGLKPLKSILKCILWVSVITNEENLTLLLEYKCFPFWSNFVIAFLPLFLPWLPWACWRLTLVMGLKPINGDWIGYWGNKNPFVWQLSQDFKILSFIYASPCSCCHSQCQVSTVFPLLL